VIIGGKEIQPFGHIKTSHCKNKSFKSISLTIIVKNKIVSPPREKFSN
jgi:hypothetical protein